MSSTYRATEAEYYGNLARVAINFYVATGNQAELDAVWVYTRSAARAATTPDPVQCPLCVDDVQCGFEDGHSGACEIVSDSLSDY